MGLEEKNESCNCKACPGQVEVPTERELRALAELRAIKERVRMLKGSLTSIKAEGSAADAGMIEEIETTLEALKRDWDQWEGERKAAAQERMILLGHEERS